MSLEKSKLRPILDGDYWMIGDNPDLGPIQGLQGEAAHAAGESESGARAWASGGATNPGMDCQICLLTSSDGRAWERHSNDKGQSRVFIGPGESHGLWHRECR